MKNPRTIVVKTLMNPDEFLAFDAACVVADVTHSKQLRDLSKTWAAQAKNKRSKSPTEGPAWAQNMAMLLPGRPHYGARMRC
jgi:hypothetical protein